MMVDLFRFPPLIKTRKKKAHSLKMADMSVKLNLYPVNKARSQVWTYIYFDFKKFDVGPPSKVKKVGA